MIHRISIAIVAQVILIVVAALPADMLRAAFLGARGGRLFGVACRRGQYSRTPPQPSVNSTSPPPSVYNWNCARHYCRAGEH
jgi:hypothetical protein